MSNKTNYFEVLCIPLNTTDDETIRLARTSAVEHWQYLEQSSIDNEERRRAKEMRTLVEEAYRNISDPTLRERHIQQLEQQKQKLSVESFGEIEVKFTLGDKHHDLNFNVIENPIVYPLVLSDLTIRSIQEYVCRAWEKPDEIGLQTFSNRSLERWIYYSAGEKEISDTIQYYRWIRPDLSDEQLMFLAMDLLQSRYPAPIIPRGAPYLLEKIKEMQKPQWVVTPSIINFDLLPSKVIERTVYIRSWKSDSGQLTATVDNPVVKLDVSKLNTQGQVKVLVNGAEIKSGQAIQATLTLRSEKLGEKKLPIYGARFKWMGLKLLNQGLARDLNLNVATKAREQGDFAYAAQLYWETGAKEEARDAMLKDIAQDYDSHLWKGLIDKITLFQQRFGRTTSTTVYLIEALRMIAGSLYQLNLRERALPYLSTLVLESNLLPGRKLPDTSWTVKAEAQIHIDPTSPKHAWVEVAEDLNLRWTHPNGTPDKTHYAGERILQLDGRGVYWRSNYNCKPPIVAYRGTLVVRRKDNRAVIGIDAATGDKTWEHTQGLNGKEFAEPVCGIEMVFVADPEGVVYGLNIETGKQVWQRQLDNKRDLNLAFENDTVVIATGTQVILLNARNGELLMSTDKMKRFIFADANPVNVLVSNNTVLFQKSGTFKKTMNFVDFQTGAGIEFNIPFNMSPPVSWAAYMGEIYVPILINKKATYPERIREYADGRTEVVSYGSTTWIELNLSIYNARSNQMVADLNSYAPTFTYPTKLPQGYRIEETRKSADVVALAPVYIETSSKGTIISPPQDGLPIHLIVAAAFGRDVFYWISLHDRVQVANYRRADSNVRAIIFAYIQDIVVTEKSFSSSLLGQTWDENSYTLEIPTNLQPIAGHPALYGDIIYVVSQSGEIAAIGK